MADKRYIRNSVAGPDTALGTSTELRGASDGVVLSSGGTAAELNALMQKISGTRGSLLVNGVSGFQEFPPGTSGLAFVSNGAGNDPTYHQLPTTGLADDSVIYAKMQNVTTNQRLLGRNTSGAGDVEELTFGTAWGWISGTRGSLIVTGASGPQEFPPGLADYPWCSNGSGSDPTYRTLNTGGITNDAVTYAKLQNVSANQRLLGRNTTGAGDAEEITFATAWSWVSGTRGSLIVTGASGAAEFPPGTADYPWCSNGAGSDPTYRTLNTGGITNSAVTYAKMQNVSATQRLLGRNTAGSGVAEEVTFGQAWTWVSGTRGSIVVTGASGPQEFPPGTSGLAWVSNGSGADPTYHTLPNSGLVNSSVTIGSTAVSLGATAATITGLTLTSPVINTPTGIVKGDVGLGNVDNTSDATKNAASVTLTNKTISSPTLSGTIAGTPTWTSNQAITLSTAAQTNITSVGTLTSLGTSGSVTITQNNQQLLLSGATANFRYLSHQTSGSNRFNVGLNDTAEGGSNAGSDYFIDAFTDAGSFLAHALMIKRSSSLITTYGPVKLASYIVSGLPSASTSGAGSTAFVTDASTTIILGLGAAVVGGGSNKVPVYSDGTNWIIG